MFRFEDLTIWQESITYTNSIYSITKKFPHTEHFALTNQLRRSSSSIAANIAEGSGSTSKKDFSHYLEIAIKSLYETVSHLQIALEQRYIDESEKKKLYEDAELLARKLRSFRRTLIINS